jgi:hypothetical protein
VSDDLLTRHPGEPVCSLDRVVDVNLDQNNMRQSLRISTPKETASANPRRCFREVAIIGGNRQVNVVQRWTRLCPLL